MLLHTNRVIDQRITVGVRPTNDQLLQIHLGNNDMLAT